MLIAVSFAIALLVRSFYLFLQFKKEGRKIGHKQGFFESLGCAGIVAAAYILRMLWDGLPFSRGLDGSFLLVVILPAILWGGYKIKPDFFQEREEQAMVCLCYLLILIFIIPILG